MLESQQEKCHAIIHGAAGAVVAAGMAQIPGSDVPVLVGIEITMVVALGAVFRISINESTAKSMVITYAATHAGRGISQALIGWVPFLGNAINAATAGALIETMGWAIAYDFDNNNNRQ